MSFVIVKTSADNLLPGSPIPPRTPMMDIYA
jgi:hypothetical protein